MYICICNKQNNKKIEIMTTNEKIVSEKVLELLNNSQDLAIIGFDSDVVAEVEDWKNEGYTNIEISEKILLYVNVMELNTIAINLR